MQATEKRSSNKVWLAVLSVGVVISLILGVIGLVNSGDTKANAIPTISQQVENIENSIPELESVSTELKDYITGLETTVEKLQTDLATTNTAIDTLETEVYGKVDAEKTATLNQLKADKTELEAKIAAANQAIADAKTANAAGEKIIADQIAALETELEKADADNKKAIEDQIASLNTELSALIKANADNITALQTTADGLQSQIDAVNTNIASIKTELESKITASEKKVLDELNTLKTSIEGQIATINSDIASLKAKDIELDGKITELKTYVDTQDAANKTWAETTFATLEQYDAIQTTISGIKTDIKDINTAITDLYADVNEKIEALNESVSNLEQSLIARIEYEVVNITKSYQEAVATAKTEITAAYTEAIADAITASETAMKAWVNEALTGYYKTAEIDAKLSDLETKLTTADGDLKAELEAQNTALEAAKTKLTAAYKEAIDSAINEHDGKITERIATDIATAEKKLQDQIDAINAEIAAIKNRLTALEKNFAGRIQSLVWIPENHDEFVKVVRKISDWSYRTDNRLDFFVTPESIIESIQVEHLKIKSVSVENTANKDPGYISIIELSVTGLEKNKDDGTITVYFAGNKDFSQQFTSGGSATICLFLVIDDGNSQLISERMYAGEWYE